MKQFYLDQDQEIPNQTSDQKLYYNKRCSDFNESPIGFNKIVFLGDSITEAGEDWNKYFNTQNIVNRGISGDTTEGVLARLSEICYYKPLAVFLLIGINDIFNTDSPNRDNITPKYVGDNIIHIADTVLEHSSTNFFIQTTLPINNKVYFDEKDWFPNHSVPLPDQINEINTLIKEKGQHKSITIIDLHSAFVDENGLLNKTFTPDGVHLNNAGYEKWTEFIRNDIRSLTEQNQKR
jgi:lysophospholipase L1-like esterase